MFCTLTYLIARDPATSTEPAPLFSGVLARWQPLPFKSVSLNIGVPR